MTATSRAGAACLLTGAATGFVSVLVQSTLSEKAADQASALATHRGAMETGLALNSISAVLVVAGVVWFAWAMHARAAWLAVAGGTLGVFGLLAVLVDNGVAVAEAAATDGLSLTQATAVVDRISGGAAESLGPVSVIGDIGLVVLAVAALRFGVARWVAAAVVVGAVAQAVGFGTASRVLTAVGFGLLFAGFAGVVRTVPWRAAAESQTVVAQPA